MHRPRLCRQMGFLCGDGCVDESIFKKRPGGPGGCRRAQGEKGVLSSDEHFAWVRAVARAGMVGEKCWEKKLPFPAGLNAPEKPKPLSLNILRDPLLHPSPLPFLSSPALQANET